MRLLSESNLTAGIGSTLSSGVIYLPPLKILLMTFLFFLPGIMPKYDRVLIVVDLLSL